MPPTEMILAICIPVYEQHVPHLERLLESLKQQTRIPERVVVSASSIKPGGAAATILRRLEEREFPFSLTILATEKAQTSGTNRNLAADAATSLSPPLDILSFFDADDEMHPRRCEAIVRAFERDSTFAALLHGTDHILAESTERDWPALEDSDLIPIEGGEEIKRELAFCPSLKCGIQIPRVVFSRPDGGSSKYESNLHFGHISILSSLWRTSGIRFTEEITGLKIRSSLASLLSRDTV